MSFTAEGLGQLCLCLGARSWSVRSCLFCVSCYNDGGDDDNKDDANSKYAAADNDNDH